ncbi:hypothetical protein CK203_019918 [Vitis vinifera]|uniref:Uncharacterized protein n=1 Tax=Vitis vinifera TaxID=29760 RepID=A0A438J305_VITVI|nr:hypothetical protein CK203_019918 [Vitis vinifera]
MELAFANEREALWNQVIRGKYGEDRGGWCTREVREVHGVGLRKGIRMDWDLVGARISFSVGNGRRVSFWRDRWCGDAPLCESFPSLYALSIEKEAWVADVWDPLVQGGGDHRSSAPPLLKNKGLMGVAFFFVWGVLGVAVFISLALQCLACSAKTLATQKLKKLGRQLLKE